MNIKVRTLIAILLTVVPQGFIFGVIHYITWILQEPFSREAMALFGGAVIIVTIPMVIYFIINGN